MYAFIIYRNEIDDYLLRRSAGISDVNSSVQETNIIIKPLGAT